MKVITPGHLYELENFEKKDQPGQTLQFIQKEPKIPGEPELLTIADGTTTEEVIAVLINRTQLLNSKFPCKENACAITKMEEALMWFEKRTKYRQKRDVEGKQLA